MANGSREWREAELEAQRHRAPEEIIALYRSIGSRTFGAPCPPDVSFSCMIDAILDFEADGKMTVPPPQAVR